MREKILISTSSFGSCGDEPLELLRQKEYQIVINSFGRKLTSSEVIELGKGCAGIIAGVELLDGPVLEALAGLRCISRCGVGTDNVDLEKARELGIMVMNTPDAPTRAVAELTVGVIFDLLRNITRGDREMRRGGWYKGMGNLLVGRKVGILGLGRIGRTVAEMLIKLGAEVSGSDIKPDPKWLKANRVTLRSTGELLKESEILTIHVSDAGEGHLIAAAELESMKKGAYLINLSRGGMVDEDALYQALKSGRLAGAALDVFEQEPYTGTLKELDNVVLTPHIGSYAREARLEMEMQAARNLISGLRNLKKEKT
jgi:D-3-phosphoglycerate dehydrogenase